VTSWLFTRSKNYIYLDGLGFLGPKRLTGFVQIASVNGASIDFKGRGLYKNSIYIYFLVSLNDEKGPLLATLYNVYFLPGLQSTFTLAIYKKLTSFW
jgi:hypothetical protein